MLVIAVRKLIRVNVGDHCISHGISLVGQSDDRGGVRCRQRGYPHPPYSRTDSPYPAHPDTERVAIGVRLKNIIRFLRDRQIIKTDRSTAAVHDIHCLYAVCGIAITDARHSRPQTVRYDRWRCPQKCPEASRRKDL